MTTPSSLAPLPASAAPDARRPHESQRESLRETWWNPERLFPATLQVAVPTACVTVFLFFSTDVQPVSDLARFLAGLNLWIDVIPLWVFLVARKRTIPFAAFAFGLYAIYFTLPVFSSTPLFHLLRSGPRWGSVDAALELAVLGVVSLFAGLYGTGSFLQRLPKYSRELDIKRALPALATFSVVSVALRLGIHERTSGSFGAPLHMMGLLGQVTLSGLIIAWLRGHLNLGYAVLTVALIGLILASGLSNGLLAQAAMPLLGFFFAYAWERRRIPWVGILVVGLLFIPLNASKAQFRAAIKDTSAAESPWKVFDLVTQFASMTYEDVQRGKLRSEEATQANQSRTNMLSTLAVVVDLTPRMVPYWGGYTYSDFFWHFIPRVIVPDKPTPNIGQEFPRRYELIWYYDPDTSYNLAQIIELYINFGPLGVLLGMFVIGLIYAILHHIYSDTVIGAMIGCSIFSGLINIESNFSLVFGSLPLCMLFCDLLVRMLPTEAKPAPGAIASAPV